MALDSSSEASCRPSEGASASRMVPGRDLDFLSCNEEEPVYSDMMREREAGASKPRFPRAAEGSPPTLPVPLASVDC